MARHESDREDLFSELLTYIPRWEIRAPEETLPVIIGLRVDGRMSIYFGADPCYHFDSQNRLLRAFADGDLYRTQGTSLARLRRQRSDFQTGLLRSDLSEHECQEFAKGMMSRLQRFYQNLTAGQYIILREEGGPPELFKGLLERIATVLAEDFKLAPAYPTRRN